MDEEGIKRICKNTQDKYLHSSPCKCISCKIVRNIVGDIERALLFGLKGINVNNKLCECNHERWEHRMNPNMKSTFGDCCHENCKCKEYILREDKT